MQTFQPFKILHTVNFKVKQLQTNAHTFHQEIFEN